MTPAIRFISVRRLQLVAFGGVLIAWELVAASGLLYRGVVPSTADIAVALAKFLSAPAFWFNFAVTLSTLRKMRWTHRFGMSSTTSYSGYSCERPVPPVTVAPPAGAPAAARCRARLSALNCRFIARNESASAQ